MEETELYLIGTFIIVIVLALVIKQVIKELDLRRNYVEDENYTSNKSNKQENIFLQIANKNEKHKLFCEELTNIFEKYIHLISDEDNAKAKALLSVLNNIKDLSADELNDKLLALLPEFEECIKDTLGIEFATQFKEDAKNAYNNIFKD